MIKFDPVTVAMTELAERWKKDKSIKQDLILCLINVRKTHSANYETFKFAIQGMKKDNNLLNVSADIDDLYQRSRDVLVAIDDVVRNNKKNPDIDSLLDELEEYLVSIDGMFEDLKKKDIKLRLSRYAVINDYLQACLNVYGENDPPEILPIRQGILIAFLQSLEADFNAYLEIRPQASQWQPNFTYYVDKIKKGIGAVQVFLDENDPRNLLLGAQTIQENAKELYNNMEDMRKQTANLFTFSKIDQIELLWLRRYRHKEGVISDELLKDAMDKAENLVAFHEQTAENFNRTFLTTNIKQYYDQSLKSLVAYERQCFQALNAEDQTLLAFKEAVENVALTLDNITQYAESQKQDTSQAVNIETFCELIAGVYLAIVPTRILRRVLKFLLEQFNATEIQDSEVIPFVDMQTEAFKLVQDFLDNGDRSVLPVAIEKLKAGTANILAYYREKEKENENKAVEENNSNGIMCVKCGTMNQSGLTYCSKCNSYLTFAKSIPQAPQESLINISQSASSDSMPQENIKKLDDLVASLNFVSKNPNSPAYKEFTTEATVMPMLEQAKRILHFFSTRPKDVQDEIDPAPFIAATKKYVKGLEEMASFDKEKDAGKVLSGYNAVREAFLEFNDIKNAAS